MAPTETDGDKEKGNATCNNYINPEKRGMKSREMEKENIDLGESASIL